MASIWIGDIDVRSCYHWCAMHANDRSLPAALRWWICDSTGEQVIRHFKGDQRLVPVYKKGVSPLKIGPNKSWVVSHVLLSSLSSSALFPSAVWSLCPFGAVMFHRVIFWCCDIFSSNPWRCFVLLPFKNSVDFIGKLGDSPTTLRLTGFLGIMPVSLHWVTSSLRLSL